MQKIKSCFTDQPKLTLLSSNILPLLRLYTYYVLLSQYFLSTIAEEGEIKEFSLKCNAVSAWKPLAQSPSKCWRVCFFKAGYVFI